LREKRIFLNEIVQRLPKENRTGRTNKFDSLILPKIVIPSSNGDE